MLTLSRWKIGLVLAALIFGVLFTLPNLLPASVMRSWPAFLPQQRLNLGLDLQGGSYLLLEVDTKALRQERLTNLVEDIRTRMRNEKIDITALGVVGGKVGFRVTDPGQVNNAVNSLRNTLGGQLASGARDVEIRTRPDQQIEVAFANKAADEDSANAVKQSIEIIRRRIDALGTKEPAISTKGVNRIVVEAPGESDPERLKAIIGKTAKLTFQMVDETVRPEDIASGRIPPDVEILPSDEGPPLAVKKRALVSGEMLTKAGFTTDENNRPAVSFAFDSQGSRRFGQATAQNIGKRFAIVLDRRIISAPVIQSAITQGNGIITGNFTAESANELAVLLKSGALPAPLIVEEQRTVGAELGADAIRAGAISLSIGAIAIVAFIILAYGLFGVFATLALVVNVLMMVGVMSMTQATLTLPGIAGMILTMAVAVDANVLIYERIRDEAHSGRPAMAAADTGYKRALPSIIDANVTTLISALIMFWFGAGPVRGFAWTLSLGVVTSVFTAVIITQVLMGWWFRATRPKSLPIA